MKQKRKLGVDLCGGVADTHQAKRRVLADLKDVVIPPALHQDKSSIIGQWFPHKDGISRDRTFSDKDYHTGMHILYQRRFLELVQPMPHAAEVLKELSAEWEIHIVSATRGLEENCVWDWSAMHGIPLASVSMTRQKPKTVIYSCCDAVIDDQTDHLEPLAGTKVISILKLPLAETRGGVQVRAPMRLQKHICVVRGWQEALSVLQKAA